MKISAQLKSVLRHHYEALDVEMAYRAKLSPDEGLKWLKEWGVDWTPVRGA